MSFKAKLIAAEKEFDVVWAKWSITQGVDRLNRPNEGVRAGKLEVEFGTQDDLVLDAWMHDPNSLLDFELRVYEGDDENSARSIIKFSNARCQESKLIFIESGRGGNKGKSSKSSKSSKSRTGSKGNMNNKNSIIMRIKLSADTMEYKDHKYKNHWSEASDSGSL